jgi:hypothetical protein
MAIPQPEIRSVHPTLTTYFEAPRLGSRPSALVDEMPFNNDFEYLQVHSTYSRGLGELFPDLQRIFRSRRHEYFSCPQH